MIEFSRRGDGRFNVWQIVDGEWTVVAVCNTHEDALAAVRKLRNVWRERREMEIAA